MVALTHYIICEEKYLLPLINWLLFVIIASIFTTLIAGVEIGALSALIGTFIATPMKELAPKFYTHIKDIYKGWSIFTHASLFSILVLILIFTIGFYKYKKGT